MWSILILLKYSQSLIWKKFVGLTPLSIKGCLLITTRWWHHSAIIGIEASIKEKDVKTSLFFFLEQSRSKALFSHLLGMFVINRPCGVLKMTPQNSTQHTMLWAYFHSCMSNNSTQPTIKWTFLKYVLHKLSFNLETSDTYTLSFTLFVNHFFMYSIFCLICSISKTCWVIRLRMIQESQIVNN